MRTLLREELERILDPHYPGARIESMIVPEFAYVVQLSTEVVLRKIRARDIPSKMVSRQAKAYRIRPTALELFGVSPAEGAARLAEFRQKQSSPPIQA